MRKKPQQQPGRPGRRRRTWLPSKSSTKQITMQKLDKTQSPVVDRTLNKRCTIRTTRSALSWAALNVFLAVVLYTHITYGQVTGGYELFTHPIFWYAECGLAAIFTLNAAFDLLRYLGSTLSAITVELTPKQKKLLGVKDSDSGFRLAQHKRQLAGTNRDGLVLSPSSFPSHTSLTSTSTPLGPLRALGGSPRYTPPSRTPSPPHFGGPLGYSPGGTSGSFLHNSSSFVSPGQSHNSSMSASFSRSGTASPLTSGTTISPLFRDSIHEPSSAHSRIHNLSARSSPLPSDECHTDVRAFEQYLKEENEREYKSQLGSPDSSPSAGPSFWNYSRSLMDYAPVLRKYQYQLACRDPQSTKSHDNDPDDPATYRGDEVWAKIGVNRDQLDSWIESLRKWLSQTIFARLSSEIRHINKKLTRIGSEDLKIGEVSISVLKQLAVTKAVHVPTLNAIVPFLEVSSNQEYLVKRIHELAQGGCIHEFKWNGGSSFKGKPWIESMPSDSEIVMHLLCSYMDSRLPPHPKYPDGKTFTSQHFIKTPDKPDMKRKDQAVLYQSKQTPPHYKVVLAEDTWDVPRGRSNLFQAILLFLHHIKNREHGMLGRINLGLSGINVLWVMDKT